MGVVRSRRWSLVALLAAALLIVSGLLTPAQAATSRSLSIALAPTSSFAGATVTVSGKISRSPKGTVVKVQRKSGKKWVAVASTKTTTATGSYARKITLPKTAGTYSFRTVVAKTKQLKAATSRTVKILALRKVVAVLNVSAPVIQLHSPVTLSGKISPALAGKVVFIQRLDGVKWIDFITATVAKTGAYTRTFKPDADTTFRVRVPRNGLYAAAVSASRKVTVSNGPIAPVITTTTVPKGRTEVSYSTTLAVTTSLPRKPGTWAVTVGALPAGLVLNATTGTISGTPTATGDTTFTVTYSEKTSPTSSLFDTQVLTLHVDPIAKITTTSLPNATAYSTYSATLAKTGLAGTWTVSSGTLPTGITLAGSTGALSGKPTVAGTYPLTFKFTDSTGYQTTRSLPLVVNPAPVPVITTTGLPKATAYTTYSTTLAKTGNAGSWSITGTLPTGITLNAGTGVLSGKTTMTGDFAVTVKFTETESGTFATKDLSLHVDAAADPVITTTALPNATAYATYSTTVAKTGNAGVWSVAGTLPTGITFDTATGALSGKPTESGDFPLTFTFTETESGTFATKALPLHVNVAPNPVISTTSLPIGIRTVAYNGQLAVSTTNPGTWSSTGTLPAGVTLAADGALTGTPTVGGAFPVTFTFTETESGTSASKSLTLTIYDNPTITTTSLPDGTKGSAYGNRQLTKTGGSGAGTWSLASGTLPTGLTLSSAGVISGTPTVVTDAAHENFTVKFTDTVTGLSSTKVLAIHIAMAGAPTINTAPTLPNATVGTSYSKTLSGSTVVGAKWSLADGSAPLPPGLTINAISGEISGTPTTAGDYAFVIRYGALLPLANNTRQFTIHVNPAG